MDFLAGLLEPFHWQFMRNALLAVLVISPLFGLLSTMVVTSRMSFFSDALGHSAFTGIAIGTLCGLADPLWMAVLLAAVFALLFTYVRRKSNMASDTVIGVFSSTAVALGIFIATFGGGSFTQYNSRGFWWWWFSCGCAPSISSCCPPSTLLWRTAGGWGCSGRRRCSPLPSPWWSRYP